MRNFAKILVSGFAVILAGAHVFAPSITIDAITLTLLVLAVIPWLLPYIAGFEIPGVIKITLPDTKAATDKLTKDRIIRIPSGRLEIKNQKPEIAVGEPGESSFESLRRIYETDPNLALVGFRIELEKRLFRLAETVGLDAKRSGLNRLVHELIKLEVISGSVASGLIELIALGNQAAHGADVTPQAAEWVLDIGPSILIELDNVEPPKQ